MLCFLVVVVVLNARRAEIIGSGGIGTSNSERAPSPPKQLLFLAFVYLSVCLFYRLVLLQMQHPRVGRSRSLGTSDPAVSEGTHLPPPPRHTHPPPHQATPFEQRQASVVTRR